MGARRGRRASAAARNHSHKVFFVSYCETSSQEQRRCARNARLLSQSRKGSSRARGMLGLRGGRRAPAVSGRSEAQPTARFIGKHTGSGVARTNDFAGRALSRAAAQRPAQRTNVSAAEHPRGAGHRGVSGRGRGCGRCSLSRCTRNSRQPPPSAAPAPKQRAHAVRRMQASAAGRTHREMRGRRRPGRFGTLGP